MNRSIAALAATLAFAACASVSLAYKESPACASLGTAGAVLDEDAKFIAQAAVDLPAAQLGATLDAFIAAHGIEQFQCAEQMAEALLGHPVAPLDAGVAPAPSSALAEALARNKSAAPGALEKLQTYKAVHLPGAK